MVVLVFGFWLRDLVVIMAKYSSSAGLSCKYQYFYEKRTKHKNQDSEFIVFDDVTGRVLMSS